MEATATAEADKPTPNEPRYWGMTVPQWLSGGAMIFFSIYFAIEMRGLTNFLRTTLTDTLVKSAESNVETKVAMQVEAEKTRAAMEKQTMVEMQQNNELRELSANSQELNTLLRIQAHHDGEIEKGNADPGTTGEDD